MTNCHPERSAAESKDVAKLRQCDATGFLDFARNDWRASVVYFLTISAFSIMAIQPRSAILPFNVTVLPQYSAN